jgi:hypothetical protein
MHHTWRMQGNSCDLDSRTSFSPQLSSFLSSLRCRGVVERSGIGAGDWGQPCGSVCRTQLTCQDACPHWHSSGPRSPVTYFRCTLDPPLAVCTLNFNRELPAAQANRLALLSKLIQRIWDAPRTGETRGLATYKGMEAPLWQGWLLGTRPLALNGVRTGSPGRALPVW